MALHITYFVHGTTTDNEAKRATGQLPGELSETGRQQMIQLKELIKGREFDVVFCSDLKRAVDSAELTFGGEVPVIQDKRLRECDYGDMNGAKSDEAKKGITRRINTPFPNGESYRDVEKRVSDFLRYLLKDFNGKRVAIVSHEAPQLALEVLVNKRTWEQAMKENWRDKKPKEWRPGWGYTLIG
jgi:broad specificity phosphatase PhoE